jgi:hypothetical protein
VPERRDRRPEALQTAGEIIERRWQDASAAADQDCDGASVVGTRDERSTNGMLDLS